VDGPFPPVAFEVALPKDDRAAAVLLKYWREKALQSGRLMPSRRDVKPEELASYLSSIMLVDVLPQAPWFRYRLTGSREVAARGFDPTGRAVETHFFGGPRDHVLRFYQTVRERREPLYVEYPMPVRRHAGLVEHSVLYLPLSKDGEVVDMIMIYSDYTTVGQRL
jgi:hypothetical protein